MTANERILATVISCGFVFLLTGAIFATGNEPDDGKLQRRSLPLLGPLYLGWIILLGYWWS